MATRTHDAAALPLDVPADGAPATTIPIRLFLTVVAAAVFLSTLTGSMVNVQLPLMRDDFGASAAGIGWVITAYSLGYAIGVPLYGRISDLYGVRRVFVFGLVGFALGGLICALAPNLPLMVTGRLVQGIGGAAIPALASVAVTRVLADGERGSALGLVASMVGVGSATGPIVGGLIGEFSGWRLLFILSLALAAILTPVAARVLPNDRVTNAQRFGLPGGILLGIGTGLLLFAITRGQSEGFGSISSWGSLLAAVLLLLGFAWRIGHGDAPFVSPALFRRPRYTAAMLSGMFAMGAYLSALVMVPLLLVEVHELSSGRAGLVLTPGALALALLSRRAGQLSDRIGVFPPILAGLVVMTTAMIFLAVTADESPWLVMVGVIGVGAGLAGLQSPLNNAAAGTLERSEVGAGMGMFAGAYFLGGGMGPALSGAFLSAREERVAESAAYGDTFLLLVLPLVLAGLIALALRRRAAG